MTNKMTKIIVGVGCVVTGLFCAYDASAKSITWDGSTNVWEVGVSGWKDAGGNSVAFEEGDDVTFPTLEGPCEITVAGNFSVGDILIDSSSEYTFKSKKRTAAIADLDGCITEAKSFVKRGSGTMCFSNFGGTWTCDMHVAEGAMECKNGSGGGSVFTALAPQNSFFGDLSVDRKVIFGTGDLNAVATLTSEANLHNPTGNADTDLVATFVFDAGKVIGSRSVIYYPKLILKNGSVIEACSTGWGNAVNFLTGDIKVARRDDNLASEAVKFNNGGGGNHLRNDPENPIVFDIDDITSENPEVVDSVVDATLGWPLKETSADRPLGYVKRGAGTLFMKSTGTYTGDVYIEGGTLQMNIGGLGEAVKTAKTIYVKNGATLEWLVRNILVGEGDWEEQACTIIVSNATLKVGMHNCLGKIKIYGSSVVDLGSGYAADRGLLRFGSETYVDTDDTLVFSSSSFARIGYEKDRIEEIINEALTNKYGKVEMCIQRAKAHTFDFADFIIDVALRGVFINGSSQRTDRFCGILKTGPGILSLKKENIYKNITDVKEGGLWLVGSVASNVVVRSGAFAGGTGTVKESLEIENGGGFLVDATNMTARLTVNGKVTLPQAGLVKLYNVGTKDVSQIKFDNLPLPNCAAIEGMNNLDAASWKVEVDGMTPRETRSLMVTFNNLGTENPSYSIVPGHVGFKVIVR